jgi:hypothetical protein
MMGGLVVCCQAFGSSSAPPSGDADAGSAGGADAAATAEAAATADGASGRPVSHEATTGLELGTGAPVLKLARPPLTQPGDIIFAALYNEGGSLFQLPAGWNLIDSTHMTCGPAVAEWAYYVATNQDPNEWDFVRPSTSPGANAVGLCAAYAGVAPREPSKHDSAASPDAPVVGASVSTIAPSSFVLAAFALQNKPDAWPAVAGMEKRVTAYNLVIYDRVQAEMGDTGAATLFNDKACYASLTAAFAPLAP